MYPAIKRMLDVVCCLVVFIILIPVFLIIAAVIKTGSAGPVFFKQKRVGRANSGFNILKFRTMRTGAPSDTPTHLLTDPDRYITAAGRFLRRTSLDELPQLINIIKGDMSVVGPRPALWNQYDLIAARDRAGINRLYPGLTGLAQVSGRDELPIPAKVRYDAEYAERMSFMFDFKILILTAKGVLLSEGVREGSGAAPDDRPDRAAGPS